MYLRVLLELGKLVLDLLCPDCFLYCLWDDLEKGYETMGVAERYKGNSKLVSVS